MLLYSLSFLELAIVQKRNTMRNTVIFLRLTPCEELISYAEYDDLYLENLEDDFSDDVILPIKKRWLYEHLDSSTLNELKCQFTDFGLENSKFICTPNNSLYYGNLRITGDIIHDLLNSKVGLYILDVEDNVIYSERATF